VKQYLTIVRPLNCLFIALAVLTGGLLNAAGIEDCIALLFAVIAAVLIAAGGYVINDFYDLPTDIINKPHRILPRGLISPDRAYLLSMFLFVLGFSLSFFTANLWAIIIAIVNSLLLYFYAKYFKRVILLGNLIVSYSAASAFLFGAVVCENLSNMLPIILFTFLYTLVREIIKDAEDINGDTRVGIKTLATVFGIKKAVIFSLFPAMLLIAALLGSFNYQLISKPFFHTVLLAYTIPLIVIYLRLFTKLTIAKLMEASLMIKLHMLLLLIVLIII
jgi:geranylgeranylglycerol-phosphate geranylgeranyltransferase